MRSMREGMIKKVSICLLIICLCLMVACNSYEEKKDTDYTDYDEDSSESDSGTPDNDTNISGDDINIHEDVSINQEDDLQSLDPEDQNFSHEDSDAGQKDDILINQEESGLQDQEDSGSWEWPYDVPDEHNLRSEIVDSLHQNLYDMDVLGALIIKDGFIVDEYYDTGYDRTSVFPMSSASKSVTATLFGIAVDQDYIEDTEVFLSEYYPQIEGLEGWQDIRLWHLLTHTAGVDASDEVYWYEWRKADNWIQDILRRPLIAEPGTRFVYSTGNTHLLSAIIETETGEDLFTFGKTSLFDPLGMDSVELTKDPQGISDGGNGFSMNLYDMAKIGQLYINKGVWEGQRIVSEGWIEEATDLQFKRSTGSADYGYQWWVRSFGQNAYPSFFAQGHGGQFIFVIPDVGLVVVFASDHSGVSSSYWTYVAELVNGCNMD